MVEAPTYHETLQLLRDHGLRPVPIEIDQDGLQVNLLADRLQALARPGKTTGRSAARARLLYTIPNFQNPSGITVSDARRDQIMDVIRFSADDVNSSEHGGRDDFIGYGRINMEKALVPIKID